VKAPYQAIAKALTLLNWEIFPCLDFSSHLAECSLLLWKIKFVLFFSSHTHSLALTFFKMPCISLNSFFLCAHTLAHIYLLNFFKNSFYFPNPDACLYQILPELFWFSLSYTLVFSIPCNSLLLKFYSHFCVYIYIYIYILYYYYFFIFTLTPIQNILFQILEFYHHSYKLIYHFLLFFFFIILTFIIINDIG
jgi:hypothetical protein